LANEVMNRSTLETRLQQVFDVRHDISGNFFSFADKSRSRNQQQTNNAFSDKWSSYSDSNEKEGFYQFQREWYLSLYGFSSEDELRKHLDQCKVIFDAGCGLGYKAAWLAELAPQALVIGMDFSEAARHASETFAFIPNLLFIQGDISATGFQSGTVDYVNCDQVIMHTDNPAETFAELARVCTKPKGEIACYFYAKKALPRELLDDYFRSACSQLSRDELWQMSEQLTELGRRLSELDVSIECPAIPVLGIKEGTYDIQRFIYWNFLKCFWNEELGPETSAITNFDWYSPSNASRFCEEDVHALIKENNLRETYFHSEDACYSGRFVCE
jgi:SAM-dependent methyltransferase